MQASATVGISIESKYGNVRKRVSELGVGTDTRVTFNCAQRST